MIKNKQQIKVQASDKSELDTVTKFSISVMGGVSALVGVWAAACLISAIAGSGGPLNLVQSWFSSVSGI